MNKRDGVNTAQHESYANSIHSLSLPSGITAGAGGRLRWMYEVNMWKNPVLILTIMKVFAIVVFVLALMNAVLVAFDNSLAEGIKVFGGFLFFGLSGMLILGLIAYFIISVIYGGRYCVLFEMSDRGVNHIQMQKQFKKAQTLSLLTTLAAAASKNVSAAGAGVLAGSTQSIYSEFSGVRKLIALKRNNCIKVNGLLIKNQVYAAPEQFDFIWAYISQRCPQATKILK